MRTSSYGFLVTAWCVATSQQKKHDWFHCGASQTTACAHFVPYLWPQNGHECVQLLLVLEFLLPIHTNRAPGLRTHSQISSTISKKYLPLLERQALRRHFVYNFKLWKVVLVFIAFALCFKWKPHYIKYVTFWFHNENVRRYVLLKCVYIFSTNSLPRHPSENGTERRANGSIILKRMFKKGFWSATEKTGNYSTHCLKCFR
jgi:hypothetical protein